RHRNHRHRIPIYMFRLWMSRGDLCDACAVAASREVELRDRGMGPDILVRAMPAAVHPEIPLLLDLYDEAFDKESWHGPNLRGAIRGVTAQQAAWRPAPGRHNIWEFTVHAAYWKYVVRRRLTGEKRGSFALKGSNFFERPIECTEAAWKQDL